MKKIVTIEIEDEEYLADAVGEALAQIEKGFTSGYNPRWEIVDRK